MSWQLNQIDHQLIRLALQEDLGQPYLDITSSILFNHAPQKKVVKIISKHHETMVLSGLPLIISIMQQFTDDFVLNAKYQDGDTIHPGETLLTLTADSQSLMMAERTILNFLQHLSGIATLTQKFVQAVQTTSAKILDTRKTLPGFRHLDKYAVHCGGGANHRMGLYDALMIKDNHIDLLGGMHAALDKLPDSILDTYPVIVEVRDIAELNSLLSYKKNKVTRVLLDNMSPAELRECVKLCKNHLPTEASGGVNLENVASIAETGVDFISVGMITHSAKNIDLSMKADSSIKTNEA